VKSIAPVGATEIGTFWAVNFLLALLGCHSGRAKNRMVIAHALDNAGFINRSVIIQCDTKLLRRIQALQNIQL